MVTMKFSKTFREYLVDLLREQIKSPKLSREAGRINLIGNMTDKTARNALTQYLKGLTGHPGPSWDHNDVRVSLADGTVKFSFPGNWM